MAPLIGVLASPAVAFGVLAVFAAGAQRHWFWRIGLLLAVAALLTPTKVGEVVLFCLIAGAQVFLLSALWRQFIVWRGEPGERRAMLRFGLGELLAATALAGAAVVLATWSVRSDGVIFWRPLVVSASLYAGMLLAASAAAHGLFRWWWPAKISVVLGFLTVAAAAAVGWSHFDWLGVSWYGGFYVPSTTSSLFAAIALGVFMLLILCRAAGHWRRVDAADAASRPPRTTVQSLVSLSSKLAIALILVPCLAATGWLYWQFAQPVASVPPAPPHPDVIADITAALAKVPAAAAVPNTEENTTEEISAYVDQHGALLDQFAAMVSQPCCTHLDYNEDPFGAATLNPQLARISASRQTARMFLARAELRKVEGDFDHAAADCLTVVRAGDCAARGGLIIDAWVGIAIESMGMEGLRPIRGELSISSLREAAAALEEVDARQEPLQTILDRDFTWSMHTQGWRYQLFEIIDRLSGEHDISASMSWALERQAAQRRLVMTELAILAYEMERGEYPRTLADLVPQYLMHVPLDPYGDGPLVYRREADGYKLYSIGPNRVDDGGQLVNWNTIIAGDVGDHFLDVHDVE